MQHKRVLLYISKFMNIYQDIIECLENLGYEVVWIEANTIANNPYNIITKTLDKNAKKEYLNNCKIKWERLFNNELLNKSFDYLFCVNVMDIPAYAFDELSLKNSNIRKVLYMYDRIDGIYQINEFFKYYDKVFSFDIGDSHKYNLTFLPIYWIPSNIDCQAKYDIFAFASYSDLKPERTLLFSKLKHILSIRNLNGFVKLYDQSYGQNKLRFIIKSIFKHVIRKNPLTIHDICTGLITGKTVTPKKYRQLIQSSKVIFDTQATYQDGLTARFMWALGAQKKIITTNNHVRKYEFYDKNQIFILNDNLDEIDYFLNNSYTPKRTQLNKIESYRIDNWVKRILG